MATLVLPNFTDRLLFLGNVTLLQWLCLVSAVLAIRTIIGYIYNAYFHPLSAYPGPKLASITDLWTTYHSCAGRWPWVIERAMTKYGDIVRIGPNSLVFLEPQATIDIHGPKKNLKDTFVKTPMMDDLGDNDNGLLWERDPEKHHRISKMMSPAFSSSSLRAKLPTINKYIDLMLTNMSETITRGEGLDLSTWLGWLAMDSASDLAFNWEMNQVRDMKTHPFLDAMDATNFLGVFMAAAKTYPLLSPAAFLFVPWKVMRSLPTVINELRMRIVERIDMRDNIKHSDYFEQLLPPGAPAPENDDKIRHMITVTGQLILGGYDATSVAIYMLFHFILQDPEAFEELKREIRGAFSSYEDIEADRLRTMPWLNACLQETLRLSTTAVHHSLPRISPGAVVNGEYISKGVICRTSLFTYWRSPRFFHDPKSFRPERWLSKEHPKYDTAFAKDNHRGHFPFNIGPRQCPGREVARVLFRSFVAKMIWLFDVERISKELDFDRDFRVYSMWIKPELRVRLALVKKR